MTWITNSHIFIGMSKEFKFLQGYKEVGVIYYTQSYNTYTTTIPLTSTITTYIPTTHYTSGTITTTGHFNFDALTTTGNGTLSTGNFIGYSSSSFNNL